MKRQTAKEIENEIIDGLEKIAGLNSTIIIKHLADIPNHDGLGDLFYCLIDLNSKKEDVIGFTMKTDFYSGDFVISSPIFSTDYQELETLSFDSLDKFISEKHVIINQDLKSRNGNRERIENIKKDFFVEIKNLNLPLSMGDTTTIEEVIVTMATIGTKTINSKKM